MASGDYGYKRANNRTSLSYVIPLTKLERQEIGECYWYTLPGGFVQRVDISAYGLTHGPIKRELLRASALGVEIGDPEGPVESRVDFSALDGHASFNIKYDGNTMGFIGQGSVCVISTEKDGGMVDFRRTVSRVEGDVCLFTDLHELLIDKNFGEQ